MPYDLSDFEEAGSKATPAAVMDAPPEQDLSDFEVAEPPAKAPQVKPGLFSMPAFNAPPLPAAATMDFTQPTITSPIKPVDENIVPESELPVAKETPSHGVFATETPTLVNSLREGKIGDAAGLLKENTMRFLRPIFGPTEQQQMAESIPVKNEKGQTEYQFKPFGSDAFEKYGVVGAARRAIPALERGIPATELDKRIESEMYPENPSDSTLKAIGKGLFNAAHRTVVTLSDPTLLAIPESRAISSAFAVDMAKSAKDQFQKAAESDSTQGIVENLLGGTISLGMAGMSGSHAIKGKPTPKDIADNMNLVPDELLHPAAELPDKQIADAAKTELQKRAETIRAEVAPAVSRLPGDVQEKISAALDKQANGEPLTENEHAALIQVRSYASRLAEEQTNADFTAPTSIVERPVTVQPAELPKAKPVTATPATSTAESPAGSPLGETVTEPPAEQPKAYTPRIAQAAQAAEPLRQAAAEAKTDLPAASAAAEELAKAVEQKASSPQPQVEPPSTTGESVAPIAEGKAPAEEAQPATEAAAVKPVEEGTRIAGPAILDENGKVIVQGQIGESHADLKARVIEEARKKGDEAAELAAIDAKHAFVDDKGNILDRAQGWNLAEKAGQIDPKTLAAQQSGAIGKELHSQNLIRDEVSTPAPSTEPPAVERPVETPGGTGERPAVEAPTEAPAARKPLLDQLEALLAEEEAPTESAKPEKSAAQQRVDAIRADIDANKDATSAWKSRRRKDLKAAEAELAKEQEATPAPEPTAVTEESATAAEPAGPKELWQKTRDEVTEEGLSHLKHRLAVRAAVERGENVPLDVLEGFSGYHWADKMRREKYGEDVSDSLLTKIIDSLKDDEGNLYFDPLFIKTIGKPALRGAVKLIREAVESGGLAKDVMTDVVNYIKKNSPAADEAETRKFFQPIIEEALGKTEEVKPETAETPKTEAPAPTEEAAALATEPPPIPKAETTAESRMVDEEGRRLTSTKNEIVDQERERRGEPPILSEAKKSLGETWDEAMKRYEKDPEAGKNLVSELLDKPRAITATDEAVLLRQKVDVMNELSKATETALNESADPGDRAEARARSAYLMDELNSIDEASRKAGTEWGRTGRFRQMLAAEDYSLSRMLQRSELAKDRPLTDAEKAQVKKMSEHIADLEKQLAEHETKRADELEKARNEAVDAQIKKWGVSEPVLKVARRVVDKWKAEADEARKNMGSLFGPEGGGVGGVGGGKGGGRKLGQKDIEQSRIEAVAKIARAHIAEVGLDLAEVTARIVKEFGEKVSPYIDRAWAMANGLIDKEKGVANIIREKKTSDPTEQRDNLIRRIGARKDAPESVGGLIQKLAENFVRSGVTDREALLDAVHGAIKEALPDATRRDVRDAISGYGQFKELSKDQVKVKLRDLKGQMQQISKLEDMLQKKQLPKKTGVQRREPSAEERQLLKEVNKVKKELGLEATDENQLKGALDAAKTRTRNRIEDLQRAIEKKEKIPKAEKSLREDDELRDLKTQRDALQKEYDATFGEEKQKRTPDEIALAAYKARTQKRIDDLKERTQRGDFSKRERKSVELDKEGLRLREEAARAKLEFDKAAYKDRMKNMGKIERILDFIPKIARASLLSNPTTFAKLMMAALYRLGGTPITELLGGGLGHLPFISEVAALAPREGGFNVKAEAKAVTEMWMKGVRDAGMKATTGKTDLDVTAGKKDIIPHHWLDFFGNLHGMIKAPVVRAEYARSFEKRSQFYADRGVDITDPMVLLKIHTEAYLDAQRAIFQQNNKLVQLFNTALRQLEMPSKTIGRVSLKAKALQSALKTLFPIVKIPTNIVAEGFSHAIGTEIGAAELAGIAIRGAIENQKQTGSYRIGKAFQEGLKHLSPDEADMIMRHLKQGALGKAIMLLGFLGYKSVGGFFQPGQKQEEGSVKPGTVRIFGMNIPAFMLHNPAVEQLQMGATIARVAFSKLRKKDPENQGIPAGIAAAALGLVEETPFLSVTSQLHKLFTPSERMDYLGELTRSRVIPQFIQWTAQQMDRAQYLPPSEVRSRKPETFGEEMEMGIPGLRENVPLRERKHTSFTPPRRSYRLKHP